MKYPFLRIPWRLVGLSLGFLLIAAVICALALPYLHDLIYPDSLSRNDLTPTGCETIGYAVTSTDRQIDELGAADHIRTEADARAYVDALMKRWDPNETNPHLAEFEERVARAEFAAVRNPEKRIPESQVTKTFNRLMDEWQMPGWAHISVAELHAFRITAASAVYPRSIARLPDGRIALDCRPTEALFLLYMLDFSGGVPPQIRQQVRETHFPWNVLKRFKWSRPAMNPIEPGPHPAPPNPESLQRHKYSTLRANYFSRHPDAVSFDRVVNELFMQLRTAFS